MDEDRDTQYNVSVGGGVSGQFAVGNNISQRQVVAGTGVTEAELGELRTLLQQVVAEIDANVPAEERGAALDRLGELEGAVTAPPTVETLSTMEYVRNWFARHLPQLAGSVAAIVVHPIVGKLVNAAGDAIADEFRRRFS